MHSSIHADDGTRDVAGQRRREKRDQRRDIHRFAEVSDGNVLGNVAALLVLIRMQAFRNLVAMDAARHDGIHGDALGGDIIR